MVLFVFKILVVSLQQYVNIIYIYMYIYLKSYQTALGLKVQVQVSVVQQILSAWCCLCELLLLYSGFVRTDTGHDEV